MAGRPTRLTAATVPIVVSVLVLGGAAVGLADDPPSADRPPAGQSTADQSTADQSAAAPSTAASATAGTTRVPSSAAPTGDAAAGTTTSAPTATAAASPVEKLNVLLLLTNRARIRAGCPELRPDAALGHAALEHSRDMAGNNYFAHTGSRGLSPIERAKAAGYPSRYVSENVAAGNAGAVDTFVQWMTSPGHRANILNCRFTEIGIGYAYDPDSRWGYYWTQLLGSPTA